MKRAMTQILLLSLCLCLAVGLSACGRTATPSNSLTTQEINPSSKSEDPVVKNKEISAMMEGVKDSNVLENFKNYLASLDKESAEQILDDPEMVYTMLRYAYWNPPAVKRFPGDYQNIDYSAIQIKDATGEDISSTMVDLWYAANEVYNVDETSMFEMGEAMNMFENAPEYFELKNYDAVVSGIFTVNGLVQLEKSQISDRPLIQRKNGKVYRMGSWKTGHSYGESLVDIRPKHVTSDKITVTVKYEKFHKPSDPTELSNYVPEYEFADFTVVKEKNIWMVEDYIYPEVNHF